jgi:mannose-6-phosphate isomerase-like protein (cupin superfamily)
VELDVRQGIVLRPGEGEEVATADATSIKILADLEELSVTYTWYGGRRKGAAPHIHKRHADSFFVLDGELVFLTADESLTAPAGSAAVIPPNVVHGFNHERRDEVRFLNFHTPNTGFAESLRARQRPGYEPERYDSFDPPPDAPTGARVVAPGEGDRLTNDARTATIKIARDELTLVEFELEAGFEGPQPHVHRRHVDSFFVVEGEPELRTGEETLRAEPGTFVSVPPGVVHSFSNPGPGSARLINVHAPSCDFHEYLHVMERERDLDTATHARFDVYEV